jgi:hypothetical protein
MAAAVKFEVFSENLAKGVHNLHTDTVKLVLCSVAPVAATDDTLSDLTQVANGNGYTTGGEDTQNTVSRSGGTTTVAAVDVVWTATGAGFGPFRYVAAQDDTPTSPADPLIEYWDYGSAISLAAGETFTADFGASGLMTIA